MEPHNIAKLLKVCHVMSFSTAKPMIGGTMGYSNLKKHHKTPNVTGRFCFVLVFVHFPGNPHRFGGDLRGDDMQAAWQGFCFCHGQKIGLTHG